jgi:hypothetical protein
MRVIDYSQFEKYHAAARRERSVYINCLFQRAIIWLKSQLSGAGAGLRETACC